MDAYFCQICHGFHVGHSSRRAELFGMDTSTMSGSTLLDPNTGYSLACTGLSAAVPSANYDAANQLT